MDQGVSGAGVREGRVRRSWRLTRTAWSLVRSHREMQALAFLGVFFAAVASVLILYLGGYFDRAHHGRGELFLVALLAGYASTVISVFFNVALVSAADEALEGHTMPLHEALGEAARCLRAIALWSLIAFGVGVLLNEIARRIPWGARLLTWLAGTAWSLATIFVVPLLALEDSQPIPAIRRSANLFKRRWGEGVSGSLTIGAWTAVATVPAAFAICVGFTVADRNAGAGALLIAGGFLTIILATVFASAARGVFSVVLYRYALDEPTGAFPASDLANPFTGPRPSLSHSRIWAWLAVALTAIVLLSVVGGLVRDRDQVTGPSRPPISYGATFPKEDASLLHPGTDVYFLHRVVGEVSEVHPGTDGTLVRMDIDPSFAEDWQSIHPTLNLMRAHNDHSIIWIALIPRVQPDEGLVRWGLNGLKPRRD